MKKRIMLLVMAVVSSAVLMVGCGANKTAEVSLSSEDVNVEEEADEEAEATAEVEETTATAEVEETTATKEVEETAATKEVEETAVAEEEDVVEKFYSQPDVAAEIDKAMADALAQQSDILTDCNWYAAGNRLVYEYVYKEGIEVDGSKIEEAFAGLEDNIILTVKDECGATGVVEVEYIYYTANGNIVADILLSK